MCILKLCSHQQKKSITLEIITIAVERTSHWSIGNRIVELVRLTLVVKFRLYFVQVFQKLFRGSVNFVAFLLIVSVMAALLICIIRQRKVGVVDDDEIELEEANNMDETTKLTEPRNSF
jgi:uncharacterized membrane protein